MKKHLALAIIFLLSISLQAQISHIELNDNWTFRQVRTDIWHKATVPGLVHTDLIDNGLIEDPFFRLNERGVQWIDKEDWEYKTIFSADEDIFAKQNIEMVFYGLDIYADVYLNDSLILKADNMFRSWRIDIKKLLKKENNELRVYFHSPIKVDIPKFDAVGFKYATDNDQSANGGIFDKQIGVFARKAGYHYGWDWGPRLVTIGIWRPIAIEAWNSVKINNIWYRQDNISSKNANITAIADIEASTDKDALITIETIEKGQKWQKKVHLTKGNNKVEIPINIKNPHLWWCNGLGEPHLYKFTASVSTNGETDSRCNNIGIRDIKIVREKDQFGTSFYVKLNGEPVFMKGANYIPQHSFLTEVTDSMYEKTILDAVNANMNMLRVWGGGIYENDIFYELCDKYGILVWQDFMFACSLYPTEGELLENIRLEAIENVIHLRNHASIALWCGNNECQAAWYGWGYKRRYEQMGNGIAEKIWKQFYDCYFVTLPKVVEEYDNRFYTPSSPYNNNPYGRPETGDSIWNPDGDGHYWGVWQTQGKLSTFNDIRCRFFSEYGFQSFPDYQSVMQFAPKEADHDIYGEVMMSHQRGGATANSRILWYLESEYRKPANFEETLYLSQLQQGDAIRIAIEAHRRDKPYCMGTLFWQHNDCWPVASWSSRDFYGRWKAQHYFAKKVFQNVITSAIVKDNKLLVYVVSDSLQPINDTLSVKIMDFYGNIVFNYEEKIRVEGNSSKMFFAKELAEILNSKSSKDVFVTVKFHDYSTNFILNTNKETNYPKSDIKYEVKPAENGYLVTLKSDSFVRGVFLSIDGVKNHFEDNYFDLLPKQPKTIHVETGISLSEFKEQLKIQSFN